MKAKSWIVSCLGVVLMAALIVPAVSLAGQDQPGKTGLDGRTTVEGRLMDLHTYMTQDATTNSDPARPSAENQQRPRQPMSANSTLCIESAQGLIILGSQDQRSARPVLGARADARAEGRADNRADNRADGRAEANQANAADAQLRAEIGNNRQPTPVGQQVKATGTLYEKRGVKYLVATNIEPASAQDNNANENQRDPNQNKPKNDQPLR